MISKLLYVLERSFRYLKEHPQFVFILMLIFVIPYLFLYSGQQFLDVGRANQDRLQKDRVGLIQDTFVSLLSVSEYASTTVQRELERITALNPDIVGFTISKLEAGELKTIASIDATSIGKNEPYTDLYKGSAVRTDESLLHEVYTETGRSWLAFRALERTPGDFYFMYTEFSLSAVDALFAARERAALFSLIYVYAFLMVLAYWHIRMTDYRYLYLKAKKESEMKDLFTNMIAHELRAPLTAIRGYASMVYEAPVSEAVQQYGSRVKDSADRLLAIVNDLLDVARIQSGKMSVVSESVDVSPIVVRVLDELHISATEKNIILTHAGTAEAHTISGDAKRLHQALTNLVSNAIKYTPKGSIELAVEEKYSKIEIRIKDTGTGISFEDQQKLFAPFFRVASDDVSKITGSGLGMWITKQFIELMGGTIAVESIKGVGTHLIVVLKKEVRKIV